MSILSNNALPSDITEYIMYYLSDIYECYTFASISKQIYESLSAWRKKNCMIGDTILNSAFIYVTNVARNNKKPTTISCSFDREILGVNICKEGSWLILLPNKDIIKWIKIFEQLNMFNSTASSKVLCMTPRYKEHWNIINSERSQTMKTMITKTIMTNVSNASTVIKHIDVETRSLLFDGYNTNTGYHPYDYRKIVTFVENSNDINIIKGPRSFCPAIKKRYVENVDLIEQGKKRLIMNTNAIYYTDIDAFNTSSTGVINYNIVNRNIFPDIIINYSINKCITNTYIRSHVDKPIIMYVICPNTLNSLKYRISTTPRYTFVRLLWVSLVALNINVVNLTEYDIRYLSVVVINGNHKRWNQKKSSLTQNQVNILSSS